MNNKRLFAERSVRVNKEKKKRKRRKKARGKEQKQLRCFDPAIL
jgi:ribosome-associated protein YbcJ (S4-like RNA binding protein)